MTDPIEIMARAIGPFTADDQPDEPHLYLASNVATCLARAGYAIVPASGTVDMVAAFWRQKNTGSQEVGQDRKSVVEGKRVSERVAPGGRGHSKKKKIHR